MSKGSYQVLGGLTSGLAFISVFGAAYIIHGAVCIRRSMKKSPGGASKARPLFIINHVLYMSVCDVAQQGWIAFSWLPLAFDGGWNAGWQHPACEITGMFFQFFLTASASWNFVIAVCLMRMLRATPIHVFEREIVYHHLFAWGVSVILCIVPLCGDAYGYVKNPEEAFGLKPFECWITPKLYQLCLYLPAMIYVLLCVALLMFTFIQRKRNKIQHASTSLRLAAYTIVFVVTWSFPLSLRVHSILSQKPAHPATVWFHHISLACIGIGNAFIWGSTQSIKDVAASKSRSKSKSKLSTNNLTVHTTTARTPTSGCYAPSPVATHTMEIEIPPMRLKGRVTEEDINYKGMQSDTAMD